LNAIAQSRMRIEKIIKPNAIILFLNQKLMNNYFDELLIPLSVGINLCFQSNIANYLGAIEILQRASSL